jgi:hypothetical protein
LECFFSRNDDAGISLNVEIIVTVEKSHEFYLVPLKRSLIGIISFPKIFNPNLKILVERKGSKQIMEYKD